jgi:hypothetical protein
MSDDALYFSQMLWNHSDKVISTSNLNLDKFVCKDNWGVSAPRMKLSINHFKTKSNVCITLSHQEIFQFLHTFKKYEDKIPSIIKEVEFDQNKQHTFGIKNKKNLFVTFLYRSEYNGACIRVVISERNADYLDSEKVYLSIFDFLSLVMVMGQFRNNYINVVDSMSLIVSNEILSQKINDLDSKLTAYYSEFTAKSKLLENDIIIRTNKLQTEYTPFDLDAVDNTTKLSIIENSIEEDKKSSSSSSNNSIKQPIDSIHDDIKSFLDTNKDSFDIGIKDENAVVKSDTNFSSATVLPTTFTEKMLSNDIMNLEMYLMNLINDDLPFSKFSELITSKLSFNPLEGVADYDERSVDYLISLFLKNVIKDNLDKKQEIPSSVPPIVFNNSIHSENKISLAYDLYLYCIYYSNLRNILKDKDYGVVANKELVTFALKTIASPYVFSFIKNIDEKILVSELLNRFRRYKASGVFSKLEKEILEKRSITIEISEDSIRTESSRIYNIVVQKWNNLTIEGTFPQRSSILKYDDIKKNKLSKEQIKKILLAEFNFRKNKRVDFKEAGINGFDDIPLSVSEKYGITKLKFDNTNLKRFIKDKCKTNEELCKHCNGIVDLINESYRDLKDKTIDFSIIPEDILKSIVLWDLKNDNKISNNYIYFLEVIQKCNLTKDMIMSMLLNISDVQDSTFTNSFLAARDE